ncbi:MAG: hypothetical protein ACK4N5_26340, partial [Myxococcales bacterium]
MLTVQTTCEGNTTTTLLTPGRHTAGGAPSDRLKLAGPPAALYLDVTSAGLVICPRVEGATIGVRAVRRGTPRLLLPGDVLTLGGATLSVALSLVETLAGGAGTDVVNLAGTAGTTCTAPCGPPLREPAWTSTRKARPAPSTI